MNKTMSEKSALHKLGISDFQSMTEDKIVKFAALLPKLNPEVAKAALEQFPDFKDLSLSIVNCYTELLRDDRENQAEFDTVCTTILDTLKEDLAQETITPEEQEKIEEKMLEVARMMKESLSEKRELRKKVIEGLTTTLGIVIAVSAVLLTARAEDSDEAA